MTNSNFLISFPLSLSFSRFQIFMYNTHVQQSSVSVQDSRNLSWQLLCNSDFARARPLGVAFPLLSLPQKKAVGRPGLRRSPSFFPLLFFFSLFALFSLSLLLLLFSQNSFHTQFAISLSSSLPCFLFSICVRGAWSLRFSCLTVFRSHHPRIFTFFLFLTSRTHLLLPFCFPSFSLLEGHLTPLASLVSFLTLVSNSDYSYFPSCPFFGSCNLRFLLLH